MGIDATGDDCLDIHDHRYFHDGSAEYWVRSVDIDRELARAADAEREELLGNVQPLPPAVSEGAAQDVSREALSSTTPASQPAAERRGSRQQRMIQQIAGEEFPDGCDQIETGVIIHRVANRLKRQSLSVPKRDTFLRALGRRKD